MSAGLASVLRRLPPLHPFLLALYPVLFLYNENLGEVEPADLTVPILVALIGTAIVLLMARLVVRDLERAALVTSLGVVGFSSYGRILDAARGTPLTGGRLLLVTGVLGVLGLVAIVRMNRGSQRFGSALTVVSGLLVVATAAGVLGYEVPRVLGGGAPDSVTSSAPVATGGGHTTRDIYYILVEDLGSEATLRDYFGLDPHTFDWLRDAGFTVASESATNYGKTVHMLASTLNMTYLDEVAARVGRDSGDYHPLYKLVDDASVPRFLKAQGYRYIHIGSWWDPTEKSSIADVNYGISAPSDFDSTLIQTTMLREIVERLRRLGIRLPGAGELSGDRAQYEGALLGFAKLEDLAGTPGPKFVFAHILIPHDPYVFDPDGSFLTPERRATRSTRQNFLGQALYTNRRLKEIVSRLLSVPEPRRPIVIIQTDEGPNPPALERDVAHFEWAQATQQELELKYSILNAFYLPGLSDPGVYPQITTVNTFRLVLSRYFGADLPLLPDRLFIFRDKPHPYDFTEITARLRPP